MLRFGFVWCLFICFPLHFIFLHDIRKNNSAKLFGCPFVALSATRHQHRDVNKTQNWINAPTTAAP